MVGDTMEDRFGAEAHRFYGMSSSDLQRVGKRSLEWDLNDWKWDGDLFIAQPLNLDQTDSLARQIFPLGGAAGIPVAGNSSNSSSSCSDEMNVGIEKGKREMEKRRRVFVVDEDNLNNGGEGGLTLKLSENGYPSSGKKTKLGGGSSSRAVCQVTECGADLSTAKDYHRRHKVCEMHSKATRALVGGVMQRFCQQCSRFHVLQEFDEGRRSCRRRLAGHNRRRRKTNTDTGGNGNSLNDEQTSSYLLISLLKILSNMQSNGSNQTTDQDVLSHLLKSLASQNVGRNTSDSQDVLNDRCGSEVVSALLSNGQGPLRGSRHLSLPVSEMPQQHVEIHDAIGAETQENSARLIKINSFDLNDIYIDSDDGSPVPTTLGTNSLDCPSWVQQHSHQSSPPQTSGNSDSASAQSPSSSNGDAQCRTDRIVLKLFGKDPNDFPIGLRAQILDWLSHSPSDMESYIRPGCIILTIYLRQDETAWEELCSDLSFSLSRLLDLSNDAFWRTGWVYIRVQQHIAFIHNGQVVVDTSLPLKSSNYSRILSVKPIAISASERAQFFVKGINLSRPATRLLCAVEGSYLVQEGSHELMDGDEILKEQDELQCVSITCNIPQVTGRGFIEIEDHGLSSSFFPFIVAEEDVCSEIRMLENALDFTGVDADDVRGAGKIEAKDQALDFIHEIGWLLHRSQVKSRLAHMDPNTDDLFPLRRFKWLIEFSMDHEWCAVVKKLLNVLLDGTVGIGEHPSLSVALAGMCLLHRAVRKNSRPLVELLLRYVPEIEKVGLEGLELIDANNGDFLFRPDVVGPAGLTPLHIAAGKDDSEDVLDALTEDPGMAGLEAWKTARDSTGFTPEDYARLRGHYSYIHLVQKKINKRLPTEHVVVDIPGTNSDNTVNQKDRTTSNSTTGFEITQTEIRSLTQQQCKLCVQKLGYGKLSRSLVYRPAMLSMVAVAAVCVCVALLFKSCPEVLYVFGPFRWEMLDYGTS